jgi:hypothetical protein
MKTGERRGNDGPWKTKENQDQVSLGFPRPWKSLRDFHIPTAPTARPYIHLKNNQQNPQKGAPAWRQPDFIPSGSSLD